jgi:hypothetical protein
MSGVGAHGESGSRPDWASHPVDVRLTIPLPFRSFYLTIIAGPEKRGKQRRADERKKHPLLTFGNMIVCLFAGSVFGLSVLGLVEVLFAYAVRSGSLVTALLTGLLLLGGVVTCLWLLVRRLFKTAPPSEAAESD